MDRRSALLKAFVASLGVYLIPVIGPHALWLLGEHLYSGVARSGPEHPLAWTAVEWALAISLQAVAGTLSYWFFARPRWWRLLPLAACVPIFFVLVEWAYLLAIPSRFLIEQDTAPESGDWKSVCAVADMSLATVRSAPDVSLEHAGEAWLSGTGVNDYTVLAMPGCRKYAVELSHASPSTTLPFVLPGGRCLFNTWDNKTAQTHWWFYDTSSRPLRHPPADPNRVAPILSNDGNWVAWLEYVPGVTVPPLPQRVVIRSLRDDRERLVSLPPPGRSDFVLLSANMDAEELTFYEHDYASRESSLTMLGLDGAQRGQPIVASGVDPQATTFLRADTGWVAWDAYRETEPYRVAWSLPKGNGTHRVPKGRGITAVAVSPGGTYVAVSTSTSLNIGHIQDAVYVLRVSDGKTLWRRNLPTYARSSVAFLGENLFAYTDWDGTHATVRVLQIPD